MSESKIKIKTKDYIKFDMHVNLLEFNKYQMYKIRFLYNFCLYLSRMRLV